MSAALLTDLADAGITIRLADDPEALDLDAPAGALDPGLIKRVRAEKPALVALLRASGGGVDQTAAEALPPAQPIYTADERRLLDKAPEGVKAMAADVKSVFADLGGATLIDLDTPRRRMARLIRAARVAGSRDGARAMRDTWDERMVICTIDGGLSEEEGERVAAAELADRP